jgi:hypothetical protein
MFHIYVATACSKCFSCFSLYVAASCFILQVANLDVSCILLHTCCKCVFQMFHLLSDICYIQIFFVLQLFYAIRPGTSSGEQNGRAARRGLADSGVVVRLRWGRARPQLLILALE